MHDEAFEWVAKHATTDPVSVLDIGGRDVNGSPKSLFPNAVTYTVLDIVEGDNVDIIADAATWIPDQRYDVIICAEVFEHTPDWPAICATAYAACKPGGQLILTMAGMGRPAHSAVDGFRRRPGEHYANIPGERLGCVLLGAGWRDITVDCQLSPADTRAVAKRQEELTNV
jgi:hypothetical protein